MPNRTFNACLLFFLCSLAMPIMTRAGADEPAGAPMAESSAESPAARGKPVDAETQTRIRAGLAELSPDLVPEYLGPSIVPGYVEVIVKGQTVFTTEDGRYLIQGIYDLQDKRDIAHFGALPGFRRKALAESPTSERIVFAPEGPIKHTVTVFTDVECGFCRKLHQDITEYNKLGIAIEYLAYPRAGMESADAAKMVSVWCSPDRRKALTDAKNGIDIPALTCDNPVRKQFDLGRRMGLRGTPMIINADGIALAGYMPPADMLRLLDELAAKHDAK